MILGYYIKWTRLEGRPLKLSRAFIFIGKLAEECALGFALIYEFKEFSVPQLQHFKGSKCYHLSYDSIISRSPKMDKSRKVHNLLEMFSF